MADQNRYGDMLDSKSREAFDSAFKAMTDWQSELRALTELHGTRALDKLAVAAKTAGWPDTVVEATRAQLLQSAKLQADMMEHITTAWRDQIKSPSKPSDLMSSLGQPAPGEAPNMAELAMAPAQLWMQATAMWQKSFTDAMSAWTGGRRR
ncbi:MAG: hypothetical protein AB7O57_06500 [Hyphomicrobiaceae bacterium]